jgi:hypothetical protein
MKDGFLALMLVGAFVMTAVLVTGALAGEYQDVDGAVQWVSTVARMA